MQKIYCRCRVSTLFWRYQMILAVNAHFQPMFREGSALATCTQKLRDLVTKIRDFFMTILQTILPCVFGKSAPVAAQAAPTPVPKLEQNVAAAALPVVAPLAPVHRDPAVVAAPPAQVPAAAAAAIAPPPAAAEPLAPPAEPPALVAAAIAAAPAAEPLAPPAEEPPVVVAALEPPPVIAALEEVVAQPEDAHQLPFGEHHRLHALVAPGPRVAERHNDEDRKDEAPGFGQLMANVHQLPPAQRGPAMLAAMRAARRNRPAAAEEPAREIRLIGTTGLEGDTMGAGPFVIMDAFHGLWDKVLEQPLKIDTVILDAIVRGGIIGYTECKDELEDDEQVPIRELVSSNRDFQIIPTRKEIGQIGAILDGLLAAMGDKKCLGALLVRENETYGLFITSDGIEVHNRFFVVDPYDAISLDSFDSPRAVIDHFLTARRKGNNFSVIAMEKLVGDREDLVDTGYRRTYSVDLTPEAAAAAAGRAPHEELD